MPNLLTLALTETTRSTYEVVAWDLDNGGWILLPALPISTATQNGIAFWDLFQITSAKIKRDISEMRSNVYRLVSSETPQPKEKIVGTDRLNWLSRLARGQSVTSPVGNDTYITLIEAERITDIVMTKKNESISGFSIVRPFYWENRVEFEHNNLIWSSAAGRVGVACKDLRWKTYWHEMAYYQPNKFLFSRDKWLRILNKNRTFLLIEYYNAHRVYVIAGVHSLPISN